MTAGLTWGDPPAAKGGPRRGSRWDLIADELRKRPGEWALVNHLGNRQSASNCAYLINKGSTSGMPRGEFEATSRTVGGEFFVYARYVGATEATS